MPQMVEWGEGRWEVFPDRGRAVHLVAAMSGAAAAAFERLPSRCQHSCQQLKTVFAKATNTNSGHSSGKMACCCCFCCCFGRGFR